MNGHVVIIDDDPITLKQLRRILENQGCRVSAFSTPQRVLQHLAQAPCDLLISDVKMPAMSGMDLMAKVRGRFPSVEVILISGYASLDGAVAATKEGAFHYLAKPFTPEQLRLRVQEALTHAQTRAAATGRTSETPPLLIGASPAMRQVEALVRQVAAADCTVMLTGESGTGKELVARALHALSPRSAKPFMAFNCGALTETLIANELFGHEKGAFTGADRCCPGLLEMADGGTLFLDEVGEMPLAMQVKLLRVLQEKEVLRVGGTRAIALDVRIVSATAKDLKAAVESGAIRGDFLFRVNVFNIHLPPLRERKEDIPLLAYHILQRLQRRGAGSVRAISQEAMARLTRYTFPGNVRELENLLERAAAVCREEVIRISDLPPDLVELELREYKRPEGPLMTLEQLEQDYIAHVLKITEGARTRAADILGIDRASLWRRLKKYGLE